MPTLPAFELDTAGNPHFWRIGQAYFFTTFTHHHTGRVLAVSATEVLIDVAAWIADDGRFHHAMQTGQYNEIEPWPKEKLVIIGRTALIDARISETLPTEPK